MNDVDESFDDIQRLIDRAHRETSGSDDVPALVWSRVRAELETSGVEEKPAMSMNSALATPVFARPQPESGAVRRFSGMVAMLAIVGILAFGGWFAAMNLPPASDGQRFAMMQATSTATATCDVDSVTVDNVMAIVKNPYSAYDESEITSSGQLSLWKDKANVELLEPLFAGVDLQLMNNFTYPAGQPGFDDAINRANVFLACAQTGTIGQVLNFMDPREIQRVVLSNHPVFRDEAAVRATVEELLSMPAITFVFPGKTSDPYVELTLSVNADRAKALVAMGNEATRYEAIQVMMLGVVATNAEGDIVYQGNADGSANPDGGLTRQSQFRLILKQSSINGQWYVWATMPMTAYST